MIAESPQHDPAALEPGAVIETPPPVEVKRQVKLIEIIWTLNDEAERIENAQAAFVTAGLIKVPNAAMMDRAHVMRSGANVLAELEHQWADVRALLVASRKKKRAGGKNG